MTALNDDDKQRRDGDGEQSGAGEIHFRAAVGYRLVIIGQEAGDGQDPERNIDPKNPPPGQNLHDDAANQGTDDGGKTPDARQVALDLHALFGGVEVARDSDRDRQDRTRADALDEAEDD